MKMQEKYIEKQLPKITMDNQPKKLLCMGLKKGIRQMARGHPLGMMAKLCVCLTLVTLPVYVVSYSK